MHRHSFPPFDTPLDTAILSYPLVQFPGTIIDNGVKQKGIASYKTATELYEQSSSDLRDRFEALKAFLLALGDDVQMKVLKYYFAFRRIKNFACVEVHPQSQRLLLFVKVDPSTIQLEKGFTRDVHNIGHYGTGDLEITVQSDADLERAVI